MKKLVASMVLGTMIVSAASMSFASAKPMEKIVLGHKIEAAYTTEINGEWTDMDYTPENFKEFMGDLLEKIDSKDKDILEKHYNAAIKLEEAEDYQGADKEWENFDKVFAKYEKEFYGEAMDYELASFDDFMKEAKDYLKDISKKTKPS